MRLVTYLSFDKGDIARKLDGHITYIISVLEKTQFATFGYTKVMIGTPKATVLVLEQI
jgi:hypothetical protein